MENDIELLKSARGWGKEALVKIFDLYASALFKYARRLCGDPVMADHIVGDVFAKLLDQISRGQGPQSNLRSYLYQMTHNLVVDQRRSLHRSAPLEVAYSFQADIHSASIPLEDRVLLDVLVKAIQNDLTEDQRHVIILRFLEGFSLNETAAILGKEVSHIKVIQNRAITKLRKNLGHSELETTA
jgi:RNA polymerase sigma-70 factor, ECF subfamily